MMHMFMLAIMITTCVMRACGEWKYWWLQFKEEGKELHGFHPVAVLLSYLAKAPLVPDGTPVVNALAKQRAMLENTFRACVGLYPENNMMLEFK